MAQRMTGTTDRSRLTWRTLRAQADAFAGKLHGALTELAILDACRELEIDHICVRLKRISDVDRLKADLRAEGRVMSSVQVNGREITLVQLHRPLVVAGWEIFGVEAPYPKLRHDYDDGWEHVEFVLAGAENTLAGVRRAFCQRFRVNGGVKTSQLAAQKSTTADRRLERPVERARQGVLSSSDW